MSLTEKDYWDQNYHLNPRPGRFIINPKRDYSENECLHFITPYLQVVTQEHPVRIIEIGCGNSTWLPYFAKIYGYKVSGLDYSEDGCRLAERNLKYNGLEGDIYCEDFTKLGENHAGKYDVLFSIGVVEHFKNLSEVLKCFSYYLAQGGLIITIVPNLTGMMGWLQKLASKRIFQVHVPLNIDMLVRAHEENGMRVLGADYLMYMGFGMINTSDLHYRVIMDIIACRLDLIHLYLQHITRWRPQSSSWSSLIGVVAQKE